MHPFGPPDHPIGYGHESAEASAEGLKMADRGKSLKIVLLDSLTRGLLIVSVAITLFRLSASAPFQQFCSLLLAE